MKQGCVIKGVWLKAEDVKNSNGENVEGMSEGINRRMNKITIFFNWLERGLWKSIWSREEGLYLSTQSILEEPVVEVFC